MAKINSRYGKLQIDFRYKGQRCREQTKFEDTPQHRQRLKKIVERIEAEITLGTFVYRDYFPKSAKADFFDELDKKVLAARLSQSYGMNALPTMGEFVDIWLAEKKIEWRDSHRMTVITNLNSYVLPTFENKRVNDITKADILNFRSTLAKDPKRKSSPLKATTINKVMTPLRMLLNEAADRYEFTSPFRGIKSLKIQKVDVEPFTLEEVRLILANVREDFRAYYTVRFFTGMRTGEIDGLQWQYVDMERRQILVRETVVDSKLTYTKNDGAQREIHMSQPVYDAFLLQRNATRGQRFVFGSRNGTPLQHNNVTKRVWYPLLRYLGLKQRRPYQTRHTAATLWLASGESPEWIARQMGHTSTEMLFRVYSRYVPNLTRQDGSAFDRLLQQRFITDTPPHPTQKKGEEES
ncbi:site-specific integrase [Thalassolituus oleivorans]|uniref:site-specific integrase n=1 Tax=Thalassolituus oleivorans TaxID=187493 RepID=UPI0023F2B9AA|nr:site-specific integrase [Thalassolituus oleivorans]